MPSTATLSRWRRTPADLNFKVDKKDYRAEFTLNRLCREIDEGRELAKQDERHDAMQERRMSANMFICEWCNERITHVADPLRDVALCMICKNKGITPYMVRTHIVESSTPLPEQEEQGSSLEEAKYNVARAEQELVDARIDFEAAIAAMAAAKTQDETDAGHDEMSRALERITAAQEAGDAALLAFRAARVDEPTMAEKDTAGFRGSTSELGFHEGAAGFRPEDRGEPPGVPPGQRLGLPTKGNDYLHDGYLHDGRTPGNWE